MIFVVLTPSNGCIFSDQRAASRAASARSGDGEELHPSSFTPSINPPEVAHIKQEADVVDRNRQWMEEKNRRADVSGACVVHGVRVKR